MVLASKRRRESNERRSMVIDDVTQATTRSSRRSISVLGWTPTMRSTSCPPLRTRSVGMLRRPKLDHGRDHVARAAPRRPGIEQDGKRGPLDLGRERGVGDRHRPAVDGQGRLAPSAHGRAPLVEVRPGDAVGGAARRAADQQHVIHASGSSQGEQPVGIDDRHLGALGRRMLVERPLRLTSIGPGPRSRYVALDVARDDARCNVTG